MNQPGPEARITNLEKEYMTLGARVEEHAADTAEELKSIREEIKQGHLQIGESMDSHAQKLTDEIQALKTTMATKDDITRLETAQNEQSKRMATKDDISRLETDITEIKGMLQQLVQQNQGE